MNKPFNTYICVVKKEEVKTYGYNFFMIKVTLLTTLLMFAAANLGLAWLGCIIFFIFIITINLFNSDVVTLSSKELVIKNMLTGVKAKYQIEDIVTAKLLVNTRLWKRPYISHILLLKNKNGDSKKVKISLSFITMFSIEKRINELVKEINQ